MDRKGIVRKRFDDNVERVNEYLLNDLGFEAGEYGLFEESELVIML